VRNVDDVAAAVEDAAGKVDASDAAFQQAADMLDECVQALTAATQGTDAPEIRQALGLANQASEDIGKLRTDLKAKAADVRRYRDGLKGPPPAPAPSGGSATTPAAPSTTSVPPGEPAHVKAARSDLPPPVVKNAGYKTHGRWSAGDSTDVAPIVSGKRDDMYATTQAHLATLGMGEYAIASHVETKLAVHMATTGLTNVTVTINNTPCPGPLGCDTLLPAVLPEGSKLTVYGTNEDGTPTVNTYTGRRTP
jgi:nucleic acid/nucleotide deaminase of polymorphic system toxin